MKRKVTIACIIIASLCIAVANLVFPDSVKSLDLQMSGRNISDLNPQQIVEQIAKIKKLDDSSMLWVSVNNDLILTEDFDWLNSGGTDFFFRKGQKNFLTQMTLFTEDSRYYMVDYQGEVTGKIQGFKLQHYLEALQSMPQEAVRQLSPEADHYHVHIAGSGLPTDYERVITYTSNGVGATGEWYIHLTVQPLHEKAGGGFHGTGDELIHLFYGKTDNGNLDSRIAVLLNVLQSSPAASSNPGDYIRAHEEEYKELLGYGEATLRYCFSEFLKGNQTDLRGHIMAQLCQEISNIWGETLLINSFVPVTGQAWFDVFKENAEQLAKQFSAEEMKTMYRASWILLEILN